MAVQNKYARTQKIMSDDAREFWDDVWTYGPWLVKGMGDLAFCLQSMYRAHQEGNHVSITILDVVPTIQGYVENQNKDRDRSVKEFWGLDELVNILQHYEQPTENKHDTNQEG